MANRDETEQYDLPSYILNIRGLSQVAVDYIIESTENLVHNIFLRFLKSISTRIKDEETLRYIKDEATHNTTNLFANISTKYLQNKYFKSNYNYRKRCNFRGG